MNAGAEDALSRELALALNDRLSPPPNPGAPPKLPRAAEDLSWRKSSIDLLAWLCNVKRRAREQRTRE
jgi:hypothetical protein